MPTPTAGRGRPEGRDGGAATCAAAGPRGGERVTRGGGEGERRLVNLDSGGCTGDRPYTWPCTGERERFVRCRTALRPSDPEAGGTACADSKVRRVGIEFGEGERPRSRCLTRGAEGRPRRSCGVAAVQGAKRWRRGRMSFCVGPSKN